MSCRLMEGITGLVNNLCSNWLQIAVRGKLSRNFHTQDFALSLQQEQLCVWSVIFGMMYAPLGF